MQDSCSLIRQQANQYDVLGSVFGDCLFSRVALFSNPSIYMCVPAQMEQVKQIDKDVKRSAKLAEFMQAHAERFGGIGDGKLLWKQLEGVRTEEDRGKIGRDNKKLLTLVKGMIKEWMTLVAGQPFKAQMAYTDIDKATKRMDQRAVLQILSRKPKFLTTSWVKTTKAGLLALGATSQIGDNYATEVGRKKLAADEPPLREAACELLGMILDPHNKEMLALIHKCTSRRCASVCLSVCIAVLRIRTSGVVHVCARSCSRALRSRMWRMFARASRRQRRPREKDLRDPRAGGRCRCGQRLECFGFLCLLRKDACQALNPNVM